MTEQTPPAAVPRWEPSEMMRKLAAWEDPYGDGPWDSRHIELQRGEAARMVAEFDRLRAIEAAAGAVPDTGHRTADDDNSCRSLLRQVDEIRLLRVEPYEETAAEHIASVIERHALGADRTDNPCHCNQPDDARLASHQRGDERFCRDTVERGDA